MLPLKATGSPRYTGKGSGDYLTGKLSSQLAAAGPKIRLFERTMLDAVMKEQALAAAPDKYVRNAAVDAVSRNRPRRGLRLSVDL